MQFTHQVDIWINFMHTVLIISLCVLYLVINRSCQEGSASDVTTSVTRQFSHWSSEWLNFSVIFDFRVFPKTRPFCQPMESMYSCLDVTDSKVISAPLSVRKSVSSHELEPIFYVLFVSLGPPALNNFTPTVRIWMKVTNI